MTDRTERPDEPRSDDVVPAYGEALGNLALSMLKQIRKDDPAAYAALNQVMGTGGVHLQVRTTFGQTLPETVLGAVDGAGTFTRLVTIALPPLRLV